MVTHVVSCISHASGKVLPRVVKFFWEILYKSRFSNTLRGLLLKLPRNSGHFQYSRSLQNTNVCRIEFFQTFHACYYGLQSSLSQSSWVFIFAGMKWKCYSISVKRVMLILLGLIFPGLKRDIFDKRCRKKPFLL